MKILSNALVSAVLLAVAASGCRVMQNAGAGTATEMEAIKDLVTEYGRCCQEEDLARLGKVFANDPDTVMINAIDARVTTGWTAIEEGYRNFFKNVENCQMQFAIHTVKILTGGQAACLTAYQEATMRVGGRDVTFEEVRMTWYLEKQDGRWRIANAHWSVPQRS